LALGEGGLWATHVTNGGIKGAVTQVDPTSGQVLATIPLDKSPTSMAVGNGAVWVANEYGTLTRIDPRTHTLTTFQVDHPLQGVALGDGVIWVSTVAPDGLLRLSLPPERRTGPRTVAISRMLLPSRTCSGVSVRPAGD
jgi:hypothetical protein